jgi:hypothetical protein
MKTLTDLFKNTAAFLKTKDILRRHWTTLNILQTFPLYLPYSTGSYKERAALTIQTINQVFPLLCSLTESVNGSLVAPQAIADAPTSEKEKSSVDGLKKYLDSHGSDKARHHAYHHLYGTILSDREKISHILEVGLGTNNSDVVSNMGTNGKPGASLRAFKEFCPNAMIYGADIDTRILFSDDRIATFYIDQTKPSTFDQLATQIPMGSFDLIIDDGLHSPNANTATLRFGLEAVRKGGWVVIEDIGLGALAFWQVLAALLPPRFHPMIYRDGDFLVFAIQRVE